LSILIFEREHLNLTAFADFGGDEFGLQTEVESFKKDPLLHFTKNTFFRSGF
jgi:hypothetical protein